jgi:DNA-binding transcriptional MerR regulator
MDVLLTIGEFSKMTYLSVKALRHYHDVGLLTPEMVDPATGYRRYATGQVGTAQAIRRFRDLDMPLDDVRQVLHAPDVVERNRIILLHLQRMQEQLERTQLSITSLQALLEDTPRVRVDVEYRSIPTTSVLVSRQFVAFDACAEWLERALLELHADADRTGLVIAGPDGALYPDEFFEAGAGEVSAFVPVVGRDASVVDLPPTTVAVLLHEGSLNDVDQTYGALGTAIAERGIGAPGPIREHYLPSGSTEVCWPIRPESFG